MPSESRLCRGGRRFSAAQRDPEFAEHLRKFGIRAPEAGASSFGTFIRSEVERWKPIVMSVRGK